MNICLSNTLLFKSKDNFFSINIIDLNIKIKFIKKLLQEHLSIFYDQIKLYFNNEELLDEHTVEIYHRYFHSKYNYCIFTKAIKIRLIL